jgi:hypothetical protein
MPSPLRVIVTGLIGHHPLGGMTWHYLQYLLGLARLGSEVYYLEDTRKWPYNPVRDEEVEDCAFAVSYLANVMSRFGLQDRWAYRFSSPVQWFGMPDHARETVLRSADLLINVSGSLGCPQNYRQVARLAYVDTDPVFTQLAIAGGRPGFRERVDAHDVHFSFGERLSETDFATGHRWRPTRQPTALAEWHPATPRREVFTTVMTWRARSHPVVHGGLSYGQKDVELTRFVELPHSVAPTIMEIAANAGRGRQAPHDLLMSKGWCIVDPADDCRDFDSYRRYIESSMAEWSVAKHGYVQGQPGWFSERSACYLAAGRPVVLQDTGFSAVLPVGEGIVPFTTPDEAAWAIREVNGNYERHAAMARVIAEEYFDSDKVLGRLIEEALSGD